MIYTDCLTAPPLTITAPEFECFTDHHYTMVAVGVAMLFLVGVAYPIGCSSYLLHYFRDYNLEDRKGGKKVVCSCVFFVDRLPKTERR